MTHPRAAWQALIDRGRVPEDRRRWFWISRHAAAQSDLGDRRRVCEVVGTQASHVRGWPMSVEIAHAYAADPAGAAAAEDHARALARALAPWDSGYEAAPPTDVVWRAIDRAWPRGDNLLLLRELLWVLPRRDGPSVTMLDVWRRADERWRDAVAADLRVRPDRYPHPMARPRELAVGGQRFADLANPFAPVVAIHDLGYAPFAVTAEAIGLYLPVVR